MLIFVPYAKQRKGQNDPHPARHNFLIRECEIGPIWFTENHINSNHSTSEACNLLDFLVDALSGATSGSFFTM